MTQCRLQFPLYYLFARRCHTVRTTRVFSERVQLIVRRKSNMQSYRIELSGLSSVYCKSAHERIEPTCGRRG